MALASIAPRRFGQNSPGAALIRRLAAVPAFFLFRLAAGVLLLKLSASRLPVGGFTVLSQLLFFAALVNTMAVGGVQNALVRQSAAAPDGEALARAYRAGFTIWGVTALLLAPGITLASGLISHLLIGDDSASAAVTAIALAALAAGPGQIWCSLLTGRQRATHSLLAQAIGLASGTAAAAWLIWRGSPQAAAAGFACGPLATMAVSGLLARRLALPAPRFVAWGPEIATLLRYSAAFTATAGYSATVLFFLRWWYRLQAGPVLLGYWLAANRISDMSTQLLGLAMVQLFLPHVTLSVHAWERHRLMLHYGLAGMAVMGAGAVVFALAARPLVHLFLSDAYLPAIPAIRIYMLGDMLRVWTLIAMYSAFAQGRPLRYALIEMSAFSLMLVLFALLGPLAGTQAPFFAYTASFLLMAVAAACLGLRSRQRG
jgi:O-antigen/teichoic acid export membrane protein